MRFHRERFNLRGNFIGDAWLKTCWPMLLVLLALPPLGFGQQDPETRYADAVAAAREAVSRNDFKAAADDYKQAVKIHPESAELWANTGLMEHEGGDYAEAIRSFQQAIRLKPGLYVPNLFLGIDQRHTGNTGAAIQSLLKAERMNETDPEAPLELGRAYSAAGKFPAAAREFARATELNPKQSDAWLGRGMAYLDQVEVDARKLSTDAPHSAYAQALYAESMAGQSRYLEAADSFKKAIAGQPQPPCLHAQFGFLYVEQQKWQDAKSEFGQEHGACGVPEFLARERASGRIDADMYQSLAAARGPGTGETSGKCETKAKDHLAQRSERELLLTAACAYDSGDFALAASAGETLATRPAPAAGGLYWSIKANQSLAVQSLDHFEQMAPNSAASHVLLGDMYRQRQHYDDALTQYKQALEISPADHAALLGLAYAYFGDANLDATITTAKGALATNPGDPELNVLMGEALIARHDYAGAEPFLQKGLAAKPQMLPHVHALLGTVYAETGRTNDAITQLEMGLPADQDGSTYYKLARMYRKAGELKKADAAMQQVKVMEQQRRKRAVTALEDSSQPAGDDPPKPTP
jgi:tetratricopeptide (TPR) repeat protein